MDDRDIVLLVVEKAGDGGVLHGHTLLQKLCYFVGRLGNERLGFRPYYYGPYSAAIRDAKSSLVALGFLRETRETLPGNSTDDQFEARRYSFELTDDGKSIAEMLSGKFPGDCAAVSEQIRRIKAASHGTLDYRVLSIAAKVDIILQQSEDPVTCEDVKEKAGSLGWDLDNAQIENAANLLCELDLVSKD